MRHIRILGTFTALLVLSGCAGFSVGYDIENMRAAEAKGDAFTRKLTEEYRQITVFEADEMYDWVDAGYFARKGLRAADGEVVDPEPIDARNLPADHVGELTSARADLVGLLDANARTRVPDLAGHAQGRFDCWIEQQEENFQPDHIAACRKQFYDALAALKAAMAPKPEPKKAEPAPPPLPMKPETFLVLFAFDSDKLTAASETVLDNVMKAAKKMGAKDFAVTGNDAALRQRRRKCNDDEFRGHAAASGFLRRHPSFRVACSVYGSTMISTRRLAGSGTPSAVATVGSASPRPATLMLSAFAPRALSPSSTEFARLSESPRLYSSRPARSA